ncbi:nuclear transport factor 2 family protein [Xanthomonas vasicola]|uniref:nuclear transport factor 2 family protein n=1 Tax=Xanthomonas vasicola TaxID=56459 RepID=UPI000DE3C92D|nr:nuclear transport factor 2 family protein [Xanthomonas vasicola]RJL81804.1 nuclear transport factor 2 family protein [Xanthomonas vasicola]
MSEGALLVQPRTLELRLLEPQLRTDVQLLEALLDPAFVKFDASGRRYTRSEVIAPCAHRCWSRVPGR